MLASRRIRGPCTALRWHDDASRYVCSLIARPTVHLPRALAWAAPAVAKVAHRSVSAGSGCDCDWQQEQGIPG
jgi:hypothetical protein